MTCFPSVTGVGDAWLDFGCRLVFGMPSYATLSHTTFPVFLSMAMRCHECFEASLTGSTSPYNPVRIPWFGSLLIAVETNTRSPQTIGLETATPGTGVFHATFSPAGAFHFTAVGVPSATPAPLEPLKPGQFCAESDVPARKSTAIAISRRMTIS